MPTAEAALEAWKFRKPPVFVTPSVLIAFIGRINISRMALEASSA